MLLKLFVLLCCLHSISGEKTGDECEFSDDCDPVCGNVQDAGCICKFGKCTIDGFGFGFGFRGPPECSTYQDCACKDDPSNCFCKSGTCTKERWECHQHSDCSKLDKCRNKPCGCTGNLCESDCITADDCVKNKSYCSSIGYTCKCETSLCKLEKLPEECDNIKDCVKKGKCTSSKPCDCHNNQCVKPWFVDRLRKYPTKNCRYPESDWGHCGFHLVDCENEGCLCTNPVKLSKYEQWGECTIKN